MAPISPHCLVDSSQRVFPATISPGGQATTKLSIIDATVARWAAFGATWFFNSTEISQQISLHQDLLKTTLQETLDEYRHFAGQIRWATENDIDPSDRNQRYLGRPIITYGASTDPGVELTHGFYERPLSDIVPSLQDRRTVKKMWVNSDFPQNEFLPRTQLAFDSSLAEYKDLAVLAIQITRFSCGGWAIGVMITHCLADAACLVKFLHSWAARARQCTMGNKSASSDNSIPNPVFRPDLLDQHADLTGNSEPKARLIKLARSLPVHRYDWWAMDAPGYPTWATASTNATKPENLDQIKLSPSTFPQWPTWDMTAPTEHVQIRFGANEVANMKQAAQAALAHRQNLPPISRFNALLAHLWILINRARQHQSTQEDIYLNVTLGLRNRFKPPLPDAFAGSPVLVGHVSHRGSDTCSEGNLGAIALSVSNMVSQFTSEAVTAYLHDAAHEVCPQRFWQSFHGHNHILATSWTRLGAYEIDFCGTSPVYVHDNMPRVDGMLQVMDVGEAGEDFDISLSLESQTMKRLLEDELLRKYDS